MIILKMKWKCKNVCFPHFAKFALYLVKICQSTAFYLMRKEIHLFFVLPEDGFRNSCRKNNFLVDFPANWHFNYFWFNFTRFSENRTAYPLRESWKPNKPSSQELFYRNLRVEMKRKSTCSHHLKFFWQTNAYERKNLCTHWWSGSLNWNW